MQDLNDKVTGGTLTAAEWNEVPSEIQNVIEDLGLVLSSGDLNQLGKAIAGYVANGVFYTDSGVADAYVLSAIGSKQSITEYTEGATFEFITGNINTGASTANISSLGVKNIKLQNGADPVAGDITGRVTLKFDSANDHLELQLPNNCTSRDKWPTIVNGTDADHDINFNPGRITNSDGIVTIILSSILVKQLDASWATGTVAGGLFSGSIASSTTYHCFVIVKDSDGTVDAGFDTDLNAANIPAGYTAYRRIHDIETDSSSNIKGFLQQGDKIILDTLDQSVSDATPGTSANLAQVVPSGSRKVADLDIYLAHTALARAWVSSPSQTDTAPSAAIQNVSVTTAGQIMNVSRNIITNSSGQVRYRFTLGTVDTFRINTNGWIDDRSE